MKQQILLLLAFTACSVFAQNPERLFKSSKNNEFFIMPAKKYTWQEALKECESRDMDLLTIETEDKAKEIKELLQKVFSGKPIPRFYVGANDLENYREFIWISSTVNGPFTYTNWEQSEPNNYQNQNERCVNIGFHAYSAAAAKLLFKSDEKNEYYIQPAQKFTWAQALQECDKQTMDLLTIEDAKKALEIENLLKKVFSKKPIPRFYLGAHDQEEFRTFNWITKDATKPFTYTNWESTEPNNYKKLNERCVHLGFHGSLQWNDINCERKYGFICQERTDFESLLEVIERA
ncbi:hypothetical protein FF38_04167 [Lucilia cuprina]|uniref:C-type lectin domain-containing protein n=1 Tax=Lucilia cuprina TaxID=7375 RepID=A0A0L0C2P5_LUCCU|nr:hypothetical protein FF38_04167 [Lucilia cuprina]